MAEVLAVRTPLRRRERRSSDLRSDAANTTCRARDEVSACAEGGRSRRRRRRARVRKYMAQHRASQLGPTGSRRRAHLLEARVETPRTPTAMCARLLYKNLEIFTKLKGPLLELPPPCVLRGVCQNTKTQNTGPLCRLKTQKHKTPAPLAAPEGSLAPLDSWLLAGSPSALRLRCAVYKAVYCAIRSVMSRQAFWRRR